MSKLTKDQYRKHAEAVALLEKDVLTFDERWFVLENWQESANHVNSQAGAFFTPIGLARDFAVEVGGPAGRVIDLCAGIGALAFHVYHRSSWHPERPIKLVCIERNPDYVAVGRKVLPEAEWICADVFDLPPGLGHFDYAIGNPPFGATPRKGQGPSYTGRAFEYHVIDIAAGLANEGAFIVPANSAPFRYSGARYYEEKRPAEYVAFETATGITLTVGSVGVDTSFYISDWRGTAPHVEIVTADFAAIRAHREAVARSSRVAQMRDARAIQAARAALQLDLFAA